MGRTDFDRTPFAIPFDTDVIPATPDIPSEYRSRSEGGKIVRGVEFACYDHNSPDAEVKDVATYLREKQDARKRGTTVSWDAGTSTLTIYAFYNTLTGPILNKYMAEAREQYGKDAIKYVKLSLAVEEARDLRFELHRWNFSKMESESNPRYWMYRKVLGVKSQAKRVVDIKDKPVEPKRELKPRMSLSEYQAAVERKAELDREIERLEAGLS